MPVIIDVPNVQYNRTLRQRIHDWLIERVVGRHKSVIMNVRLNVGGNPGRITVLGGVDLLSVDVTYPDGIIIAPREV